MLLAAARGAIAGGAVGTVAPPVPSNSLVAIVAALLGGGILAALFQVFMRWRKGPIDDALQLQKATELARQASSQLFESYRIELEAAKRQLKEYLDQLLAVNRELGAAEVRIKRLEAKLASTEAALAEARGAHETLAHEAGALREQLRAAIGDREALREEVSALHARVHALEAEH